MSTPADPALFDAPARPAADGTPTSWAGRLSPFWKRFGALHRGVYEATDGLLGDRLLGIPMLLLSTVGRRSGLVRTLPLAYLPDPERADRVLLVASNGGAEKPPAWWLNLQANDLAQLRVGRDRYVARASVAPPARRPALWRLLRRQIPPYRVYEQIEREIPIVLLDRVVLAPGESPFEGIRKTRT